MTLNQFQTKYNGKFVDFDGNKKFWCVDLARQYVNEVLGLSGWALPPVGSAKELYTKFKPVDGFSRIKNIWSDLTCIPKVGDLVIWGYYPTITGWDGHVGICTYADGKNLIVFNQNYPTGSASLLRKFSYRGVLGWLHPTKA